MHFIDRDVKIYFQIIIFCVMSLRHQSFSLTLTNSTNKTEKLYLVRDGLSDGSKHNKWIVKNSITRKNNKFIQSFKNSEFLSAERPEYRQSNKNKRLNVSLIVSQNSANKPNIKPYFYISNEFTELEDQSSPTPPTKQTIETNCELCKCQCNCDDHQKAEELINSFVMTENEDLDMDLDDLDELDHIQRPSNYYPPMETIELAHQRPYRVPTTVAPPTRPNQIKSVVNSMTSYLSFSTVDLLQMGFTLALTGVLGLLGGPYSIYRTLLRSAEVVTNRHNGYTSRQNNETSDPFSLINQWIQSLE